MDGNRLDVATAMVLVWDVGRAKAKEMGQQQMP